MTEARPVRVCVDTMGGDFAPAEVLEGVTRALAADPALEVILTGPADIVVPYAETRPRATPHPTTQVIAMEDHPASAVRSKGDSSIVVGCRLVRDGEAEAFFSAGSTGACMAAATLVMGRLKGVARPAIATIIPTPTTPVVLLDVGANADCKPEHLVAFAHMGIAYAQAVLGVTEPAVGLLNIGEEATKGSALAIEAHALMLSAVPGFAGNVEGREVLSSAVDVIVTDGFTGNVVLKLLEGTSRTLLLQVREAMTSSPIRRMAAAVLAPSVRRMKARLDPDTYGGAPLLGVRGVCIIGHGSSSSRAVCAGIGVAARAVRGGMPERISTAVAPEAS
ncbi:MAG: phosphate acyltransferase PlsX [Anaerosomatales bacterium]|nr:phosphate acyltransferase PlsX [Anaerosomatales bacterium]MDT8433417.1 phosphate acyltransferase PlsX [Anaerosomatales bacterium]